MNNILPFRGKKFSENLAQRILDSEIESNLKDAVDSYKEELDARKAFDEMFGHPLEQLEDL